MSALRFHELTVKRVSPEAAGAVAITLAIPDEAKDSFAFEPGQFLTLRARVDGQDVRRNYSISSPKSRLAKAGELEIGIRPVEGGLFSNWAAQTLKAGARLDVMPPEGRFVVKKPRALHRVGFAAGSGITPILSIAASTLEEQPEPWCVYLLRSLRSSTQDLEIYRTFEAKDKDDTFKLVDTITKLDSFDYTSDIGKEGWSTVSIPHTWNAEDCVDDFSGFYRGTGWYRKNIQVDSVMLSRSLYLFFEGANQRTKLFVNRHRVGEHIGGYTFFCFDITPYIREGENQLVVCVDNSYDPEIPPLSADFTFFGGIYRDVSLISVSPIHISTTHYASSGVYVNTPEITACEAITVANVASMTMGTSAQSGANRKNGFLMAAGSLSNSAPCPKYCSKSPGSTT